MVSDGKGWELVRVACLESRVILYRFSASFLSDFIRYIRYIPVSFEEETQMFRMKSDGFGWEE